MLRWRSQDVDAVLGNVLDVYDLTCRLQSELDNVLDVSGDSDDPPYVGSCFFEIVEVCARAWRTVGVSSSCQ